MMPEKAKSSTRPDGQSESPMPSAPPTRQPPIRLSWNLGLPSRPAGIASCPPLKLTRLGTGQNTRPPLGPSYSWIPRQPAGPVSGPSSSVVPRQPAGPVSGPSSSVVPRQPDEPVYAFSTSLTPKQPTGPVPGKLSTADPIFNVLHTPGCHDQPAETATNPPLTLPTGRTYKAPPINLPHTPGHPDQPTSPDPTPTVKASTGCPEPPDRCSKPSLLCQLQLRPPTPPIGWCKRHRRCCKSPHTSPPSKHPRHSETPELLRPSDGASSNRRSRSRSPMHCDLLVRVSNGAASRRRSESPELRQSAGASSHRRSRSRTPRHPNLHLRVSKGAASRRCSESPELRQSAGASSHRRSRSRTPRHPNLHLRVSKGASSHESRKQASRHSDTPHRPYGQVSSTQETMSPLAIHPDSSPRVSTGASTSRDFGSRDSYPRSPTGASSSRDSGSPESSPLPSLLDDESFALLVRMLNASSYKALREWKTSHPETVSRLRRCPDSFSGPSYVASSIRRSRSLSPHLLFGVSIGASSGQTRKRASRHPDTPYRPYVPEYSTQETMKPTCRSPDSSPGPWTGASSIHRSRSVSPHLLLGESNGTSSSQYSESPDLLLRPPIEAPNHQSRKRAFRHPDTPHGPYVPKPPGRCTKPSLLCQLPFRPPSPPIGWCMRHRKYCKSPYTSPPSKRPRHSQSLLLRQSAGTSSNRRSRSPRHPDLLLRVSKGASSHESRKQASRHSDTPHRPYAQVSSTQETMSPLPRCPDSSPGPSTGSSSKRHSESPELLHRQSAVASSNWQSTSRSPRHPDLLLRVSNGAASRRRSESPELLIRQSAGAPSHRRSRSRTPRHPNLHLRVSKGAPSHESRKQASRHSDTPHRPYAQVSSTQETMSPLPRCPDPSPRPSTGASTSRDSGSHDSYPIPPTGASLRRDSGIPESSPRPSTGPSSNRDFGSRDSFPRLSAGASSSLDSGNPDLPPTQSTEGFDPLFEAISKLLYGTVRLAERERIARQETMSPLRRYPDSFPGPSTGASIRRCRSVSPYLLFGISTGPSSSRDSGSRDSSPTPSTESSSSVDYESFALLLRMLNISSLEALIEGNTRHPDTPHRQYIILSSTQEAMSRLRRHPYSFAGPSTVASSTRRSRSTSPHLLFGVSNGPSSSQYPESSNLLFRPPIGASSSQSRKQASRHPNTPYKPDGLESSNQETMKPTCRSPDSFPGPWTGASSIQRSHSVSLHLRFGVSNGIRESSQYSESPDLHLRAPIGASSHQSRKQASRHPDTPQGPNALVSSTEETMSPVGRCPDSSPTPSTDASSSRHSRNPDILLSPPIGPSSHQSKKRSSRHSDTPHGPYVPKPPDKCTKPSLLSQLPFRPPSPPIGWKICMRHRKYCRSQHTSLPSKRPRHSESPGLLRRPSDGASSNRWPRSRTLRHPDLLRVSNGAASSRRSPSPTSPPSKRPRGPGQPDPPRRLITKLPSSLSSSGRPDSPTMPLTTTVSNQLSKGPQGPGQPDPPHRLITKLPSSLSSSRRPDSPTMPLTTTVSNQLSKGPQDPGQPDPPHRLITELHSRSPPSRGPDSPTIPSTEAVSNQLLKGSWGPELPDPPHRLITELPLRSPSSKCPDTPTIPSTEAVSNQFSKWPQGPGQPDPPRRLITELLSRSPSSRGPDSPAIPSTEAVSSQLSNRSLCPGQPDPHLRLITELLSRSPSSRAPDSPTIPPTEAVSSQLLNRPLCPEQPDLPCMSSTEFASRSPSQSRSNPPTIPLAEAASDQPPRLTES